MKPDLTTRYLGLQLRNPVVASASPLCGDLGQLARLEEAGVAAVVLPSLFEEQIEQEAMAVHGVLDAWAESHPEAAGYFPELPAYNTGPDAYLELVSAAARSLSIPVIGSLNGSSPGGWIRYARLIEQAGASALELNLYAVEANPLARAADVENRLADLVRDVRAAIGIPLAVKIGPYFTAFAHTARELVHAGADGLVLFNRFLQPDIDPETLAVVPTIDLSTRAELRVAMRWIAILRGRVATSLAATGGVHEPEDVVKVLLAGGDVAMTTSALLERGPEWAATLVDGVRGWLADHEYESVRQLKGSLSQTASPDPGAFERAGYMQAITSFARPR